MILSILKNVKLFESVFRKKYLDSISMIYAIRKFRGIMIRQLRKKIGTIILLILITF